jgi:hypothetical protein
MDKMIASTTILIRAAVEVIEMEVPVMKLD